MEAPNGTITQHLEGFLLSARKLEENLGEEKKRSQKIAQEYLATRTTLENAVRELQNRLAQRENKIQTIAQAFQNLQAGEARTQNDMREMIGREKKAAAEVAQYQSAWNEVLSREAQARGAIVEFEKSKGVLNEQRAQIKVLEAKVSEANQNAATHSRHAETYQRELQGALIRIQSAEAKYNQIQKEISVLTQSKRNADEEIARLEASMKERFRWELATEKERLRAELEKDSALDRERFREITRNQMRAELERQAAPERQAREAAEEELARMENLMNDTEKRKNAEIERADRADRAAASAKSEIAMRQNEITVLQNEIGMHQLESNSTQSRLEAVKKESNKTMLVERLRHDEEIRDLQNKIEQLVDVGVYVEKVDEVPSGARVYSATSLVVARSKRDGEIEEFSNV